MFEQFDDHEPAQLRPRVDDIMREAKRRTFRRIGATSTCLVLLFGAAITANRYFRSEQTVRIQDVASGHKSGSKNAPGNHGTQTPVNPGGTQPTTGGKGTGQPGGGNGTTPGTAPASGSPDPSGNQLNHPNPGGGETGGTVPSGGGSNPTPAGLVWSATANTTSSPSATNAFITVTVTVTNNSTAMQEIDFKECAPTCKRVKVTGDNEITPDWDASEGAVVSSIAPGDTVTYQEVIRMRTGAGFLDPGAYTLVIYGTSVPITIV
jgi:hypothetical protein